MGSNLASLAAHYADRYGDEIHSRESLRALHDGYAREREASVVDAVAATAALDALVFADQADVSAINPQMLEAARSQWGYDLNALVNRLRSLGNYSPDGVRNFLSQWKGKYFEEILKDKLNAGESVGGIQLGPGQQARLFPSPTHPGSDLEIVNADGTISQELQAKATNYIGYVKRALEKYPDIPVITTSEAAEQADSLAENMIFNSGVRDAKIEEDIRAPVADIVDDTGLENFVEAVVPGLPFILITASEGRRVLMGRQTLQDAANRIAERGLTTGAAMAVGHTLTTLTGAGIISLPATFATRLGIGRFQILNGLSRRLKSDIESIRLAQEDIP